MDSAGRPGTNGAACTVLRMPGGPCRSGEGHHSNMKTDRKMRHVLLPAGACLRPAKATAFKHPSRKTFPHHRPSKSAICLSAQTENSRRRRLNPPPLWTATAKFPRLGQSAFKIFQAVWELSPRPQGHPLLWLMRAHSGSSCSPPPVPQPLPSGRTWSSIPSKRKSQDLQSGTSVAEQQSRSTVTNRSRWPLIIIIILHFRQTTPNRWRYNYNCNLHFRQRPSGGFSNHKTLAAPCALCSPEQQDSDDEDSTEEPKGGGKQKSARVWSKVTSPAYNSVACLFTCVY
jgi:hypothetical protein